MEEYLEFYQFHEKDENDNLICLYCVVKKIDGKRYLGFIRDYDTALSELKEFAYNNKLYTLDDLLKSDKFHAQMSNKDFRDAIKEKYNYDSSKVTNFNDIAEFEGKLKAKEENPTSKEKKKESTSKVKDKTKEEDPTKKESRIKKIMKKIKEKVSKHKITSLVIATAAIALGVAGFKGCGKSGTTDDLRIEDTNYTNDDDVQKTYDTPTSDVQDPSDLTAMEDFDTYLRLSSPTNKKYMTRFKKTLSKFNTLAKNYIDVPKNSRLGLDTTNYTAFEMALLGDRFGNNATDVSTYWNHEELYKSYMQANDQLKQLATVQQEKSGFATALKGSERREFYQKYEDMIIDLNKTTDENEKINKAENILKEFKNDFNMDSADYNPLELLKSDPKYIAVMPMVSSVYDRAMNCNYENIPTDSKMQQLIIAYKSVVSNNIYSALASIDVKKSITPSYEMYTSKIEEELQRDDLYVIDDVRSIKDTDLYKQNQTLPVKAIEITPTPTVVAENNIESQDYVVDSTPVYTTTDDNYEYQPETTPDYTDTSTDTNTDDVTTDTDDTTNTDTDTDSTLEEEPTINDQIIESDEDTNTSDNQTTETEETIVDSMNDTINNGGYAETPDGWQIDDSYKIDGTNVIDGSISDITIEDQPTEEVPTVSEDASTTIDDSSAPVEEVPTQSEDYGIIESEENYTDDSISTNSIEETPTYDDTSLTTVDQTVAKLTQEQAIDQVINYNTNGINAVPVFNTADNSWHVEVVDTQENVKEPIKYSM